MPVKFYQDRLRFAGVIHKKPILSKYILHCHVGGPVFVVH